MAKLTGFLFSMTLIALISALSEIKSNPNSKAADVYTGAFVIGLFALICCAGYWLSVILGML